MADSHSQTDAAVSSQDSGGAPVAHEGGGHSAEHVPELENFWNLLAKSPFNESGTVTHSVIKHFDPYVSDPIEASLNKTHQNIFFSLLTVCLVSVGVIVAMRKRALIPNRAQSAVEMVVEGLNRFFMSLLGEKHGPRYRSFLIGLFVFILFNNLIGLVPLMKSSTNLFQCNIALGVCVFLYVQYTGMRYLGPKHYVLHLLGNPESGVQWCLAPLMLVLELVGELIKPISLSLRLFGNLLGEDVLLGVFTMMGITVTALLLKPLGVAHPWVGIPLEFPFLFLALLTSTIQALIFSLLAAVYISLMLPHEEGHGH